MSTALPREFLVQRLVADSRDFPSSHSSDDDRTSDTSSDTAEVHPEMLQNAAAAFGGSFLNAPLHYAATLASLAQMNFFQPAANTLPLLYPHLYQSLLTFPNLDQLRNNLHSPQKSPIIKSSTPDTAKSTQSMNVSPSPRKRPSVTKPKSEQKTKTIEESPFKKLRAAKKLQFDDETSSPVSGMFIRSADILPPKEQLQAEADLDDSAKWVEITEEAKEELAKIQNVIGDYVCSLCKVKYEDAFRLAQHRCPRIEHEEYRCPECDKVFSCPANLASHRRWHKPKITDQTEPLNLKTTPEPDLVAVGEGFQCKECDMRFDSHRMLRDHAICHTEFAPKDNKEYKCPDCHIWFPTELSVAKHKEIAHQKFLCKFCPEVFGTSSALTRHINKQHPSGDCRVVLLQELNGQIS